MSKKNGNDPKRAVTINWGLSRTIFSLLLEALNRKKFPYNGKGVPHVEENYPSKLLLGGIEEARFLFTTCFYMRGAIQSDLALKLLAKVYDEKDWLFDPDYINQNQSSAEEQIRAALLGNGLSFGANTVPAGWVTNFVILNNDWQGDPRKLIESGNFDELCQRMVWQPKRASSSGLWGFREKMVSMLIFFLMDRGLVPYRHMPVPVDFHVLRVLTETRIIIADQSGHNGLWRPEYLAAARDVTYKYCIKTGASMLRLCDALWLLSRNGCRNNPGNSSRVSKERNGRRTPVYPSISRESCRCGECPIEKYCIYNVPAAPYYIKGILQTRGERNRCCQQFLFK